MRKSGERRPREASSYRAAKRNAMRANRGKKLKNERTIARYIERKE